MQARPFPLSDERVSVSESRAGWNWRVTLPDGRELAGEAADLQSACRTGAFAAAVTDALARARARRF